MLEIGSWIGHYRVVARLGAGGMGEVYRAHDTKLGRDVALKVLSASLAGDEKRAHRIRGEARLLASLNHPNVGSIYGLEDFDEATVLVLELVEGESLAEVLETTGPLPLEKALGIARDVAAALAAAHGQGIVHRDLKPANVVLDEGGAAKVLDFGIAQRWMRGPSVGEGEEGSSGEGIPLSQGLEDDEELPSTMALELTDAGVIEGTIPYMSPEQLTGDASDTRTDIWSFACFVYELLVGHGPFRAETVAGAVAVVLASEPDWQALWGCLLS